MSDNSREEEKELPWIGRVHKTTIHKIYFDWAVPNSQGFWESGISTPKGDHVTMASVLAQFSYDHLQGPMPKDLKAKLCVLSGIDA